jgi:hypothetical protein
MVNGHIIMVNGHTIMVNGHVIMVNGHIIMVNGHIIMVNGHTIMVNGHVIMVNGLMNMHLMENSAEYCCPVMSALAPSGLRNCVASFKYALSRLKFALWTSRMVRHARLLCGNAFADAAPLLGCITVSSQSSNQALLPRTSETSAQVFHVKRSFPRGSSHTSFLLFLLLK